MAMLAKRQWTSKNHTQSQFLRRDVEAFGLLAFLSSRKTEQNFLCQPLRKANGAELTEADQESMIYSNDASEADERNAPSGVRRINAWTTIQKQRKHSRMAAVTQKSGNGGELTL